MFYIITMRVFCAGFTTVVSLRRGAAGFRNKSESEEAASRFVRAVYTARLIEIAEVRLPVWPEEAVRFGRQEKVFLIRWYGRKDEVAICLDSMEMGLP